jgi:hypothetical protein
MEFHDEPKNSTTHEKALAPLGTKLILDPPTNLHVAGFAKSSVGAPCL